LVKGWNLHRILTTFVAAIIEKSQGLMTDLWRDEILLQVVKQTNGNKSKYEEIGNFVLTSKTTTTETA